MSKPLEQLEEFAIDVILERRYGKRAAILRVFLHALSGIYHRIVRWRLALFEKRIADVHTLGCQVISVGNLTVGGTGKTPIVEKLARELTRGGRKVAILSRGYKSVPKPFSQRLADRIFFRTEKTPPRIVSDGRSLFLDSERSGDEPFMLANNLKDVVVLVDKNRVKSGLYAIERYGCDTLLLDDGFQYLYLKERLDVVLIDRESPFGNRFLLPRGTLREPPRHLKRANILFITKCTGSDISDLKEEIRRFNRHAPMIECAHHPVHLEDVYTGEKKPLEFLKGLRVGALSGIARPESFEHGLKALGAEILYSRRFADHHRFTQQEIINTITRSKARSARAVITTEKDAVRFTRLERRDLPVYFLRVEIKILQGQEIFDDLINRLCHRTSPPLREVEAALLAG
jgi:tetraacyldisaccharide 4'-kinase